MWEALATVRDLGRLQEIAAVLVRYGFGDAVRRMGMANVLERAGRLVHWQQAEEGLLKLDAAQRVRAALQELGPTFVKFGQILATRVDLLPPRWIEELGELQNAVPALDFELLRPQLVAALGDDPERVFAHVEHTALAAASLAQAHGATLHDGTRVVLKVRRPGITEVVEADLRLLAQLAAVLESRMPELQRYRACAVVRQFASSLRRELDFIGECRNAERIAANFAGRKDIVIPRVHWQWTSETLAVQDLVVGIPGRDLAALDASGIDRVQLARTGAGIVMKMVLRDGFFHADPHPGNIFYMPDGAVGVIDFGMVGRLSERRRFQLVGLLHGLAVQDAQSVADVLVDWTEGSGDVDETQLIEAIDAFVDQYRGVPLKDLRMATMLADITHLLREHGLTLPPDLALMIKAFLTLEGLGRQLDPQFDMASEVRPFLESAMLERYSPGVLARRGRRTLANAFDLMRDMPRDLHRLLQGARQGRMRLKIDVDALEQFGDQIDRAASRLTMGVVTAALIIGSSIVMNAVGGMPSRWLMAMGVLGFIGAALCGVWIVLSIWRGGRH